MPNRPQCESVYPCKTEWHWRSQRVHSPVILSMETDQPTDDTYRKWTPYIQLINKYMSSCMCCPLNCMQQKCGNRSSPSTLCRLTAVAGAINSSVHRRWPCVSCGCRAGVEQSATTDQCCVLNTDITTRDLSFPSVIWLTKICHCFLLTDRDKSPVTLYVCKFCKVSLQRLWWRHLNLDICNDK